MFKRLFHILLKCLRIIVGLYARVPIPIHPFCWRLIVFITKHQPPPPPKIHVVKGLKWRLNLIELTDVCIYYYGFYEYYSTKIVKNKLKKNWVVFDIGANIGYYTLLLSQLVGENGKVYAFEPISEPMNRLKEHCQINNIKNVILEKKALSDNTKPNQPVSFTYSWPIVGECKRADNEGVDFISLDDYVRIKNISSINFMKIDVDGYEYKVLSGGKNTIRRFKPIILIELARYTQEKLEELVGLLDSFGYFFYSEKNLKNVSLDELLNAVPETSEKGAINVLCKPCSTSKSS